MPDWDSLYTEASAKAVAGGKKRFYDNRVVRIVGEFEDGKFAVRAVVRGDREYHPEIIFDEQGGLYDYTCDCAADTAAEGPCRHIVAAALAYENKYPHTPDKSVSALRTSDAGVHTLIESYGKLRRDRNADEGEKIKLTPTVEITRSGRLHLKLSVGIKKMYIVRDIADFVSCCSHGAVKRYGVELILRHVPQAFDQKSAELMNFVCASFREKTEFLEDAGEQRPDFRDRIGLAAGAVDEFFALYEGQLVSTDEDGVKGNVRLVVPKATQMNAGLKLTEASGGYLLEHSLGRYVVVSGKKYRYIVTESRIFTVTEEYYNSVMPLLYAIKMRGRLFVSAADMSQFYNSVLARAAQFIEVDAGGIDLSVFEAAPLELRTYFEMNQGTLRMNVEASYDGEATVDLFDDEAVYPFVRDYESETAFLRIVRKYFPAYPTLCLDDEGDVYKLFREGLRELSSVSEVYLTEELKRITVKKPPRIRVGVRLDSDWLDMNFSAEGYTSDQLREILQAYSAGSKYVRLGDGSFVDLLDASIAALSEVAALSEEKDGKLTLPLHYAQYVDSELRGGFFELERTDGFKQLVKELSGAEESLAEVPQGLKSVLRNYQKSGYRWLKTLTRLNMGGILADDMGLGKTLQIIALLLDERKGTSIVVCPTTLVLNWVNELSKFAPELKVLAVSGAGDERRELVDTFGNYDVVITSYELLRRDAERYEGVEFEFAVADEAQYIKNPETKNAKAVKMLKAKHRFALTGTPVENSLAELWSIFDFLMPGYLFDYVRFRDTMEEKIVHGDENAAARLNRMIKPFVLRRLKSAVLQELPPKMESEVYCELTDRQRDLYAASLSLVRENLEAAGEKANKMAVLAMLTRLRQICCDPRLVYSDYDGNSAKPEACLELVRTATASGHKVLIFSQFTSMLEILRAKLAAEGITHYLLQGDTPKVERVKLVSRFNSDATQVFLISLKAGGTGLNLTGADVVIHYDPWWNVSVMNQATDRAYRIGQDKSVQVYKLIMQNSIEQQIMKLQQRKSALSDIVLGSAQGLAGLKYEDILELLKIDEK